MGYFNPPHDIRSFSINQPLHPRLVPLGSILDLIRLLGLLAITVSACSDRIRNYDIPVSRVLDRLRVSPAPRGLCGATRTVLRS
jgi:hypothetical protein